MRAHRLFMSLGRDCRVDDLFAVMGDQGAGDVPDTSPMSEVQQERAAGRGDRLGGKSVGYSGIDRALDRDGLAERVCFEQRIVVDDLPKFRRRITEKPALAGHDFLVGYECAGARLLGSRCEPGECRGMEQCSLGEQQDPVLRAG